MNEIALPVTIKSEDGEVGRANGLVKLRDANKRMIAGYVDKSDALHIQTALNAQKELAELREENIKLKELAKEFIALEATGEMECGFYLKFYYRDKDVEGFQEKFNNLLQSKEAHYE